MSSGKNPKIKPIPLKGVISMEDWEAGRVGQRRVGNLIAPPVIRRKKSSSDKRFKRLYKGKRGPAFKKKLQ